MDSIDELGEHLARGRLAVFYGSDLAADLTGLPGRAELAAGLAERHGLPAGLSLAATAQRIAHGSNRWSFTDFLSQQLKTFGKQPQRVHQLLAQLPVQTIITTAYDNLLERALDQAGVPFNKLVHNSDLTFADRSQRILIKLYGDLGRRDTLIITEDDHYSLRRNRDKEGLLEKVRETLRDHAVLFVGYHMADPDFLLLWRETLDQAGQFAIGAYTPSPGMAPSEQQMWQGRHVQVLDMEPLDCLERLAAATGAPGAPPPMPANDRIGSERAPLTAQAGLDTGQGRIRIAQEPIRADRSQLAQLLSDSGRAAYSSRNALCIEIGIDPGRLTFMQAADRDFALQLVAHLHRTGNNAALGQLCQAIAPELDGQSATRLAEIRAKLG